MSIGTTDPSFMKIPFEIIRTHILSRLDGRDLAVMSCVSSELHSLSTEEKLWQDIATKRWPSINHPRLQHIISSFPFGHQSFYSDAYAYPLASPHQSGGATLQQTNNIHKHHHEFWKMIVAIDVKYNNEVIYSTSINDIARWSMDIEHEFQVSLPYSKEFISNYRSQYDVDTIGSTQLSKNITLSWILIDPTSKRAVNLSSLRPVVSFQIVYSDDRHNKPPIRWYVILFATVLSRGRPNGSSSTTELVQCWIRVAGFWNDEKLHVKEVFLRFLGLDGRLVMGVERLNVLGAALVGERGKRSEETEKEMYKRYDDLNTATMAQIERNLSSSLNECQRFLLTGLFVTTCFFLAWCLGFNFLKFDL